MGVYYAEEAGQGILNTEVVDTSEYQVLSLLISFGRLIVAAISEIRKGK